MFCEHKKPKVNATSAFRLLYLGLTIRRGHGIGKLDAMCFSSPFSSLLAECFSFGNLFYDAHLCFFL